MSYKDKNYSELTKEEKELVDKKMKISMLVVNSDDNLVYKFFEDESDEMLDLKLDVLTKLANGKCNEVSNEDYYKILELYPKDENILWDWLDTDNIVLLLLNDNLKIFTNHIDPQLENTDVSWYFGKGMIKPSQTYLLRIDDKEITSLISKCVKGKSKWLILKKRAD